MCSLVPAASAAAPVTRYTGCKRPHSLTVSVDDDNPASAEHRANDAAADNAAAQLVPLVTTPLAQATEVPIDAVPLATAQLVPLVTPLAQAADVPSDAAADAQLVQFVTPPAQAAEVPVDAVPLATAAPDKGARVVEVPVEPWWIRERLLPHVKLRVDLPVHFICEKAMTVTDLDPHQNRFRLPTDGVRQNLRPILSPAELGAAHMLDDDPPKPNVQETKEVDLEAAAEGEQLQMEGGIKKKKKKSGIKHGGLPVLLVNCNAGIMEMMLTRWESSRGTIIKGDGYMKFINASGLKEGDVVDVWAFKQPEFRCFGETMYRESALHVVITKKEVATKNKQQPNAQCG